jgi:peroxiredoxin
VKILFASALLLVSIWACGQDSPRQKLPSEDHRHARPEKELVGKLAPDFDLPTLDGQRVKLSELRGKAVLLNFWATFVQPSKLEMPWFAGLQRDYQSEGFQVIAVNMDDDASIEKISEFVAEMGVNYPILMGNDGVAKSYNGVVIMPTTYFINREGTVVAREFGLQSRKVYEKHVKEALGQANGTGAEVTSNPGSI